jgi:hypothetical protein
MGKVGLSAETIVCCTVVSARGYPRCHGVQVTMDSVHPLSLHYTKQHLDNTLVNSESESELLYDWRFTTSQFVLAPSPWGSRPEIFTRPFWLYIHGPHRKHSFQQCLWLLRAYPLSRKRVSQPLPHNGQCDHVTRHTYVHNYVRIYTINLPLVSHGCETWSLTVKEEHKLGQSVCRPSTHYNTCT